MKRRRKENVYALTEAHIEKIICQFDASSDGAEDLFARLRSRVGTVVTDNGANEACEEIAAAEIAYALATSDFRRIHEEGLFLRSLQIHHEKIFLERAAECLALVVRNTPLLKEMGAAWKRNLGAAAALLAKYKNV